jgi:hypothetical protein
MSPKKFTHKWPGSITRILRKEPECPVCTSIEFQPSPPRPLDSMLQLINLVPLQCTNCWRYFYWLQNSKAFVTVAGRQKQFD